MAFLLLGTAITLTLTLWVKFKDSEKPEIGRALRADQKSGNSEELKAVMAKISGRLLEDRKSLARWVNESNLSSDIEILEIPADGSFLLVKATARGIHRIACAATAGSLPTTLLQLGF